MSSDLSIADIKTLLQARVADLARQFAPDGKRQGKYWNAKSPFRQDKNPSFTIWLTGAAPGAFKDWGDDTCKGDILDLVAACACGSQLPPSREHRVQALRWAKDYLGLTDRSPEEIRTRARKASAERIQREQREAQERAGRETRAFELWLDGKDPRGTLAEIYFREARGVELSDIPNLAPAMRFRGRLDHFQQPHAGPAITTIFMDEADRFRGVHVTWLSRDGRSKCGDVDKPKMMFGSTQGLALRISNGPSGLGPRKAAEAGIKGPLAITEGIEDALSVAASCPDLRVWAAGSLSNMGAQELPDCCDAVIVCADNDWGKPQAQEALERALQLLRRQGRPVTVARAFGRAKDMNDLIRRGACAK